MKKLAFILPMLIWGATNLQADDDFQMRATQAYENVKNTAFVFCELKDKDVAKVNIHYIDNYFSETKLLTRYYVDGILVNFQYDIESQELRTKMYSKEIVQKQSSKQVKTDELGPLISALNCEIKLGDEPFYKINSDEIHINVHPHTLYDANNEITEAVQNMLNGNTPEQLVLLDYNAYNRKEPYLDSFMKNENRFFNMSEKAFTLAELSLPESAQIKVSPTGKNLYQIFRKKQVVHFSGGNQNYCMWNTTRKLIDALIAHNKNEELVINYYTEAIVVQPKGIIGGFRGPLHMSRSDLKKGRKLSNIFESKGERRTNKYHQSYMRSMNYHMRVDRTNRFSKIIFEYNAPEYSNTEVIEGTGTGEFKVILNYL